MRQTQFIGLTKDAQDYLKDAIELPTEYYVYGMFEEKIPLGIWKKDGYELLEQVQFIPWSGGPMIFTHLKAMFIKPYDMNVDCGHFFSWVINPKMKEKEFDMHTGHMYV